MCVPESVWAPGPSGKILNQTQSLLLGLLLHRLFLFSWFECFLFIFNICAKGFKDGKQQRKNKYLDAQGSKLSAGT